MLNLVQLLQMLIIIIMTILTTHWRLRSEVKGIQTSLAQCQWCTHTLIPRFFIEIKLPASPLIIMMITLPSESTPSNQHSSTLSWEISLFTPQSATATQAGSSSTETPTESSSESMAKRVIPTNNDSQTEVRFLLF